VVSTAVERRRDGGAPVRGAVRLCGVSYLNAAPLLHGLPGDADFALERELPSRVAELLHAGRADVGMIPSIEYARGDYAIVPGVAIASRGKVRSVVLYLRQRLEQVRRVATDRGSRTSVALLRLLLRDRLGRDPEYVEMPPDVPRMFEDCDAALVIGDAALYYEGDAERLDLGQMWHALTGMPFVWAFWAGRPGALSPADVARLQRALGQGLRAIPEIAQAWSGGVAGRAALNQEYLRHNIAYGLGGAEQAGLREFLARSHAAGLIPRLPELRFHADR
jgi:chorismate dehydratase